MAQGCHLIYSNSDREHFPLNEKIEQPTVEEVAEQFTAAFNLPWENIPSQGLVVNDAAGVRIDESEMGKHGIEKGTMDTFTGRYQRFEGKDKALLLGLLTARGDRQSDIITGIGNVNLNDNMANALPNAIDRILMHDKNCTGLFNGIRKSESPWISNLKNSGKGRADGIAYEVLGTAKMLDAPPKGLSIGNKDDLNFGVKMQASYGGGGNLAVTDFEVEDIFNQPFRGTVEADLLISRPFDTKTGSSRQIAVDFKHSISQAHIAISQLHGVVVAIMTGEVDEFHFVSNTSFSGADKTRVETINNELKARHHPPIKLFENYNWE